MAKKPRRRAGRKRRAFAPRQPSGQIRKSEYDRPGPTPEAEARREELLGSKNATGELDCVLDLLAAPVSRVISEKQAEAGRRYAMARMQALRATGINPGPSSPRLSEWVDNGSSPADAPDDGKSAYRWRKAWMCVYDCGADVRKIVDRVCVDNVQPRTDQITKLRIGLDALIRLWRI